MESIEIYIDENGYERFVDTNYLVHREVAYHVIYLENREDYPFPFSKYVVHHVDGDKLNNDVSNLEILLPEEHAEIHGKVYQADDCKVYSYSYGYGLSSYDIYNLFRAGTICIIGIVLLFFYIFG